MAFFVYAQGRNVLDYMIKDGKVYLLVAEWPVLAAYQARCEGRPAFQRALQDHRAAFARFDRSA